MISNNLKAFLTMIAESEGTQRLGHNNGYDVLVGGTLFKGKEHPRKVIDLGHGLKSSAAGRYQILTRYYDFYRNMLKLPDFSPESQDKIAIQMIKECKAMPLIEAGNLAGAVKACNSRWASFTGAGYGQHEHKIDQLKEFYVNAGGNILA